MPANPFARQWEVIRDDALEAVDRVGRSGWLILGEEVERFESAFAEWWGIEHAVGAASGLDALEIALRCAGIGPGDRVITTPLTAFATTIAILRCGAEPVWCDVDASGGLDLDAAAAAAAADRRVRAVLPVHLYGHPLDHDALRALSAQQLLVIEDCAQSAGARRDGEPTGRAGVAAATSLYPTKNLGAMGDGGVLLTADAELATRARQLRNYGQARRYEHVELGLNSRLDELQAAILRSALLPRLDGWVQRRQEIAGRYRAGLAGTSMVPIAAAAGDTAAHLFPVVATRRADAEARLAAAGVEVGRHYPVLCPDQPAATGRGVVAGLLTQARHFAEHEISLPLNPHLTDAEVERVIEACQSS